MDTSPSKEVKAPQRFKTRSSHVLVVHARPGAGRVGLSFTRLGAPGVVVEGDDVPLYRIERSTTYSGRSTGKTRLDDVWVEPEGLKDLGTLVRL